MVAARFDKLLSLVNASGGIGISIFFEFLSFYKISMRLTKGLFSILGGM